MTRPAPTRPPGRPEDQALKAKVNEFLRWKPEQSLFIEDIKSRDIEFFRRAVIKAGGGIRVVDVKNDPIHNQPGIRIIRKPGPYDNEI